MKTETLIKDENKSLFIKSNCSDLNFNFYDPKQGHPDFNSCYEEAVKLSEKILPKILTTDKLTFKHKMQTFKRRQSSYRSAVHNFFINKRRYKKGNHAFRPLYAIWTTLNDCNFKCKYCDNHQGGLYPDIEDPDRLNTEDGKRLLEVIRTGTTAIYWCGGEPTMRKDLPELLDYACNLGFFPNIINTNGSILHQRLLKDEWNKFLYQMDIIVMSLDGLNMDQLNDLWQTKKARQVIVNLLLMRELKNHVDFKLCVNCVIIPGRISEARDVFNLACDLGIWFVPVPVNIKHGPNKELMQDKEYLDLANLILERKKNKHRIIGSPVLLKKLLFTEEYECLTTLKPHIWSNGSIAFPCRASHSVKPMDINLLDFPSFDAAYEEGRKYINPDFFHGNKNNQCGGECAWMQNYTTDRYADGFKSVIRTGFLEEVKEFILNNK